MAFEHVQTIAAPSSAVWDATLDVEGLPDITPTIEAARLLDPRPVDVGSRVELRQPDDKPRVWVVEEVDAGRRFVWSTSAVGTTMRAIHEITPIDEASCTNTLRIELAGVAAPLVRVALARTIRRNLEQENAGFAAAVAGSSPELPEPGDGE